MTYEHHLIDYSSQSRRGGDARSKTKTTGRRKTDNAKHGQKRRRKKAKTRDGRRRQRQDNRRSKDVCEICYVNEDAFDLVAQDPMGMTHLAWQSLHHSHEHSHSRRTELVGAVRWL
eukprot:gnl/TRDRNA2_/TRDRNA2_176444_c11_seq12.p1 gnl/TRDRNA2_/TRDRNA2_176444_c11~~gnl/TRDRNA2_/TRDRNA2_176444_c11_seq12.p1  ORF type:complete len:129 (+),score=6.88 gnl/TRDRNA2_/TRDRNA2_176444_c11_seq12:40-387(+)